MEECFAAIYRQIDRLMSSIIDHDFGIISNNSLQETYLNMHNRLKTDLSIEIGAHNALYSARLKEKYGNKISVCAVEGSPKTYQYFSEKNNFRENDIEYINAVISSHDGKVDFYEYYGEDRSLSSEISSLYIRDTRIDNNLEKNKISVKSITGDSLIIDKYPQKNSIALWIDVEGAQEEVLSSLSNSFIAGKINSVYIEVENTRCWPQQKMLDKDIIAYMNKMNFMPFLRDNQFGVQYNILFLNKNIIDIGYEIFCKHYMAMLRKDVRLLNSDNQA